MSKTTIQLLFALFTGLFFSSCNPNCEIEGDLSVNTPYTQPGFKVNVTANPMSLLKGKLVYFGNAKATEMNYDDALGLTITVPNTATNSDEIRIEDPDCGAIKVLKCGAHEKGFYTGNPKFITPMIPEIIIPLPSALPFPATIDKAWLSVEDPYYCLWFDMRKDTVKVNGKVLVKNGKIVLDTTKFIDNKTSFEQTTCPKTFLTVPYLQNPIYGTYDSKAPTGVKALHFFVDRTKNGGIIEEFEGFFVDIDKQFTKYANIGETKFKCENTTTTTGIVDKRMLMITSKETGMSYLIYHSKLGQ